MAMATLCHPILQPDHLPSLWQSEVHTHQHGPLPPATPHLTAKCQFSGQATR